MAEGQKEAGHHLLPMSVGGTFMHCLSWRRDSHPLPVCLQSLPGTLSLFLGGKTGLFFFIFPMFFLCLFVPPFMCSFLLLMSWKVLFLPCLSPAFVPTTMSC